MMSLFFNSPDKRISEICDLEAKDKERKSSDKTKKRAALFRFLNSYPQFFHSAKLIIQTMEKGENEGLFSRTKLKKKNRRKPEKLPVGLARFFPRVTEFLGGVASRMVCSFS